MNQLRIGYASGDWLGKCLGKYAAEKDTTAGHTVGDRTGCAVYRIHQQL